LQFQKVERDAFLEQSKVAQRTFERGEGDKTGALEAQASFQMSEAKVVDAIDFLENTNLKLEALIGGNLDRTATLSPLKNKFSPIALNPADFSTWKEKALANNSWRRG
jgi:protease secretion system outer membrane protein